MNSVIFSGKVMHARAKPVQHRFSYPVYFYGFDVDELEELDKKVFLFGHNRLRPVSLRDRDYLLPGDATLREKVLSILRQRGHDWIPERIILVTSARVMHYVFNPVSFFYCYDKDGKLQSMVAQVNNTFGEMHIYLLTDPLPGRRQGEVHFEAAKAFHVSPFFDRMGKYDFYFTDIRNQGLDAMLHYSQGEELVFAARLKGTPRPLESWTVAAKLLQHPLTASLTKPRILWQAARLKFQKHLPVIHKPPPSDPMTIRGSKPGLVDRLGRSMITAFFSRIKHGALTLIYPEGKTRLFGEKAMDGEKGSAVIKVLDNAFFRRTLFHGGIGLGESWMAGEWETGNLTGTLTTLAINLEELSERHHFLSAAGRTFEYTRHLLKPNTVKGSRNNIQAHYDMSNDFFALYLDRSMTYSSGIYKSPETTLEEAQQEKLRTIIEKAGITATDHVLEVGCGWGSFAIQAAQETGCRVTGITISREQLELARNRVREAGLEGQVELEFMDYRHVVGSYDKIVSIEMLEAVGHANLGTWFSACDRALVPGGKAVVQVITIPHNRYHQYRRSSDWIRKHIFPGGHLPSLEAMQEAVQNHTTLLISSVESIGKHYVRTLQDWDRYLKESGDKARTLGLDETFLKKWEYYFAYCQAGFETGSIDNLQIVLEKAGKGRQG